ncbi:hypothetical protein ACFTXM_40330 [Streptomyces sp. NPDC056930]|uniref:hypothetical protein n=1 Tax=Streptomyces sp. NPDC056930 TaxID=3345967 RepID=UPI00363E37A3
MPASGFVAFGVPASFQAQRLGGVDEPAVVRHPQVQDAGDLGEEGSHLLVAADDRGVLRGSAGQLSVDAGEEADQIAGAGT